MNEKEIDVYSPLYRELLAQDNEAHRIRTMDLDEGAWHWTYDPLECSLPSAWAYDLIIGSEFRRWERIIRKKFGRPIRIIDLGCGPGGSSLWFAAQGHDVIGVDACAERIEVASKVAKHYEERIKRVGGRLRYECGDFFGLEPENCDAIISIKTLHHVPDVEALIIKYAKYLSPKGCFFVLDQVGKTDFSNNAAKMAKAFYPPGICKTPWLQRQKTAVGAALRMLGIRGPDPTTPAEAEGDPLEGVGQELTIPSFQCYFRNIAIRNLDPLRVLFVANDLKDWACKKLLVIPFVAMNHVLRLTGPCLEKSIVAHMEDFKG